MGPDDKPPLIRLDSLLVTPKLSDLKQQCYHLLLPTFFYRLEIQEWLS